jgi:hypothetical protein
MGYMKNQIYKKKLNFHYLKKHSMVKSNSTYKRRDMV